LLTGAQGTVYIDADQLFSGSPFLGAGLGSPATIGAITAANLSATSGVGSANTNNGMQVSWQFSLVQCHGIIFERSLRTSLEALATTGEVAPGSSSAATEFLIALTN
tara:strand:+ start:6867 stop:7187 length:321 start_codon:yes stop_codon:yes gene_type:complete